MTEVTRTCRYDRANLGGSDPAPGPRGLPELVGDLEQMIAAEIPGPYVLVGTSGGGYITAGYAFAHPEQVKGMVFVDVGSPFIDPPAPIVEDTRWDSPVNIEKRDYLQVEKDAWAARKEIGDIPVTVITNEYSADEIAMAEFPSERAGMETNVEDQQGWLVLSPRARQVVVHTGHAVDEANPRLVTDAIIEVVEAARAGGPRTEPRTAVTIAGIRTGRRPRHPRRGGRLRSRRHTPTGGPMPAPAFDVEALRAEFPALARRGPDGRPAVFLDGPGGTQVPQRVIDAVTDYYRTRTPTPAAPSSRARPATRSSTRPTRPWPTSWGPPAPRRSSSATTCRRSRSTSGARIGATLHPGDEIVVTTLDHEANVSTWQAMAEDRGLTVRTGRHPRGRVTLDVEDLESKLNDRTKLVAVGYASNAVGTINPVAEIVARAHEVGALTYVDAVAYAPHGPIDVRALDTDFLVCSRLQVVRAAPRRAVRQGGGLRPPAGVQGAAGARPIRDRHRCLRSRSRARSPRPTTFATSAARTATSPGRQAPPMPASGGANSSPG